MKKLIVPYSGGGTRSRLSLGEEWTRRWTGSWIIGDGEVAWPVRDLASVPVLSSRPVRKFTWRARQGNRPGLQFMVSTGRHHAFESLEEQRLLLALDFLGVSEVLPQPFRLDFDHVGGRGQHIPDFLAVMPGGLVLFDVRPGNRIEDDDRLKFDAAAEAAAACGWQYVVVTGWRQHVHSVLDHLSSQRRPLKDQLGLQRQLIGQVNQGPLPFGELVDRTILPAVARAHATHLLWHRRLAVGLGRPLGDGSLVWLGQRPRRMP
ncbi:TnsA-like heteromeric transposase endonuclease subunit [Streptomyces sp. SF28]|nr:TnsA-like heteromeric transposase endonuclease subunit [Streptomyces pinistramenti]MCB5906025.1 TnsA-like heteromeric transposase endonuclease subunit [Streptomyces pinistramenti]